VEKAIKILAQREGKSVEYIRTKIQEAINMAKNNPDPQMQEFWRSIPYEIKHSLPEEMICFIADKVSKQL